MAALLCSLTLYQARQHRPCHQRAIHSGHKRSPADTHRHHHGTGELRRSPPFQVTIPPDLALGAGGQSVEGCIDLALPGRPAESSACTEPRAAMIGWAVIGRVGGQTCLVPG